MTRFKELAWGLISWIAGSFAVAGRVATVLLLVWAAWSGIDYVYAICDPGSGTAVGIEPPGVWVALDKAEAAQASVAGLERTLKDRINAVEADLRRQVGDVAHDGEVRRRASAETLRRMVLVLEAAQAPDGAKLADVPPRGPSGGGPCGSTTLRRSAIAARSRP